MASVSSRYARALADAVFESRTDVTTAEHDLKQVVQLFSETDALRRVWENPSIPSEQRRAVLDALAPRIGLVRIVRNFIAVLIDHERIRQLPAIARQFELELNARMGFAEAQITSVHDLEESDRDVIERQVERVVGKKIRARYQTDKALLGGAVVRVGSTVYDGSLRGQLARIKEQLSAQ